MKKLPILILLGMFMGSSQLSRAQVFGHPGATWVFHSPEMWSMCSEVYEIWEYSGDTIVLGVSAKNIEVQRKNKFIVIPDSFQVSYFNRIYNVSGDSVRAFIPIDSSWQLMYDFSLQTGDTTHSPLRNIYGTLFTCEDSLQNIPAIVTNNGVDTIHEEAVRFYTVKYAAVINVNNDTTFINQTYYERIITLSYWYDVGLYFCGGILECGPPTLSCYKDNDWVTDSLCIDLTWFNHLKVEEENELTFNIYPSPTSDFLIIQHNSPTQVRFQLLSADGKLIWNNIQSPIDVSNLSPGVYFINNESRGWYKKFIKQ